jgi:hypothetical protein
MPAVGRNLSQKAPRKQLLILRRSVLMGMAAWTLPRLASAQYIPKLIVLGAGITSPVLNVNPRAPKREWSLRSWLVCNGAQADRAVYAELFAEIGERAGSGDGVRTFNLPSFPLEMKGNDPIRGMAICPSAQLGTPAATLMPFDVDSNI